MNTFIPGIKMTIGGLLARLALITIVVVWTLPTFGLLISSLRNKDLLPISGWWEALQITERDLRGRTAGLDAMVERDGTYVIAGDDCCNRTLGSGTVASFGGSFLPNNDSVQYEEGSNDARTRIRDFEGGTTVTLEDGSRFTLHANGSYEWVSDVPFTEDMIGNGKPFLIRAIIPPTFTLDNYNEVLSSEDIDQSFINTFTVTIPATIIPIAIAAFAAYAFAWMDFPFRRLLFAIVVGLLVIPLQMALIPLLKFYNWIDAHSFLQIAKTYPGVWLAHTGFGLPLAIYLLYNYIAGLPREIIESAKIDGASHFQIFVRLILPLSIPALASFSIFQFLWVWNDLLVALVFLSKDPGQIVMTSKIRELIGSRGDNWEILTSSAFVSMLVPLIVFFSLQRYFVRGLLAGSVKGG
jgi:alpha-glucoside transport system permease protein